jgi:hypothetical protein
LSRLAAANRSLTSVITVQSNTINCTAEIYGQTGPALNLALERSEESYPSAIVSDNRLNSEQAVVIAWINGLADGTITGNIVGSRWTAEIALQVMNVGDIAITGNVVMGRCTLPANRPFPAPLNSWAPLNTLV